MKYKLKISKNAERDFKSIDKKQKRIIDSWIKKNILDTENPRKNGKYLQGNLNELWSYRVGSYRIIVEINDNNFTIVAISIAHRKEVYEILKRRYL